MIEMNRDIDTKWVERTYQNRDQCSYNFSVVVQILATDKGLAAAAFNQDSNRITYVEFWAQHFEKV